MGEPGQRHSEAMKWGCGSPQPSCRVKQSKGCMGFEDGSVPHWVVSLLFCDKRCVGMVGSGRSARCPGLPRGVPRPLVNFGAVVGPWVSEGARRARYSLSKTQFPGECGQETRPPVGSSHEAHPGTWLLRARVSHVPCVPAEHCRCGLGEGNCKRVTSLSLSFRLTENMRRLSKYRAYGG